MKNIVLTPFQNNHQNKLIKIITNIQFKIRLAFTLPIVLYQRLFSHNFIPMCRFVPSCSEYTKHAILKYGVILGILFGMWRILRCNPFSKGGYDPLI